MIIALDGPAGAGKSTVARQVAQELGFAYINTGAMYRAVALFVSEHGFDLEADVQKIIEAGEKLPMRFGAGGSQLFIGDREVSALIHTPQIGALTSKIAAIGPLREKVVARQREIGRLAENEVGGAVLEGRDIQTVVFPDAQLKIFLTASDEARAHRRLNQWIEKGDLSGDFEAALRDVQERDARDSSRDASPMKAADDGVIMLCDDLSAEEVVEKIVTMARDKGAL